MRRRQYHVYVMTNNSSTLYIGMTNNLERRIYEHKHHLLPGFTAEYHVTTLVHYETYGRPIEAIEREKQLKGWTRRKKIALIRAQNPQWLDLAADWYADEE